MYSSLCAQLLVVLGDPCVVLGIEPMLATFKASTLISVLSLRSHPLYLLCLCSKLPKPSTPQTWFTFIIGCVCNTYFAGDLVKMEVWEVNLKVNFHFSVLPTSVYQHWEMPDLGQLLVKLATITYMIQLSVPHHSPKAAVEQYLESIFSAKCGG